MTAGLVAPGVETPVRTGAAKLSPSVEAAVQIPPDPVKYCRYVPSGVMIVHVEVTGSGVPAHVRVCSVQPVVVVVLVVVAVLVVEPVVEVVEVVLVVVSCLSPQPKRNIPKIKSVNQQIIFFVKKANLIVLFLLYIIC